MIHLYYAEPLFGGKSWSRPTRFEQFHLRDCAYGLYRNRVINERIWLSTPNPRSKLKDDYIRHLRTYDWHIIDEIPNLGVAWDFKAKDENLLDWPHRYRAYVFLILMRYTWEFPLFIKEWGRLRRFMPDDVAMFVAPMAHGCLCPGWSHQLVPGLANLQTLRNFSFDDAIFKPLEFIDINDMPGFSLFVQITTSPFFQKPWNGSENREDWLPPQPTRPCPTANCPICAPLLAEWKRWEALPNKIRMFTNPSLIKDVAVTFTPEIYAEFCKEKPDYDRINALNIQQPHDYKPITL